MLTFKSLRRSIRRSGGRQSVAAGPQVPGKDDPGGAGVGKQTGGAGNRSELMPGAVSLSDVKNCGSGPAQPPSTSSSEPLQYTGSERFQLAVSRGQADLVLALVNSGASCAPDKDGRTALHIAAQNGHSEIVQLLIGRGYDVTAQDKLGYTALHRACAQGHLEVVTILLSANCPINRQDECGNTALHGAAWNGYSRTLELLIQHRVNVSLANKAGFTSLHTAAQRGHNQSARILLYSGCHADLKNNYGDTALHTAVKHAHAGVTQILVSAKCRLDAKNRNGETALHMAAATNRLKIARLLLEAGIKRKTKSKGGETALDVARRLGNLDMVSLISTDHKTLLKQQQQQQRGWEEQQQQQQRPLSSLEDYGSEHTLRRDTSDVKHGRTHHGSRTESIGAAERTRSISAARPLAPPNPSQPTHAAPLSPLSGALTSPVVTVSVSVHSSANGGGSTRVEPSRGSGGDPGGALGGAARSRFSASMDPERLLLGFQRHRLQGGSGGGADVEGSTSRKSGEAGEQGVVRALGARQGAGGQVGGAEEQPIKGALADYVVKPGVQFYKDLAGNLKQGPVGFTPIADTSATTDAHYDLIRAAVGGATAAGDWQDPPLYDREGGQDPSLYDRRAATLDRRPRRRVSDTPRPLDHAPTSGVRPGGAQVLDSELQSRCQRQSQTNLWQVDRRRSSSCRWIGGEIKNEGGASRLGGDRGDYTPQEKLGWLGSDVVNGQVEKRRGDEVRNGGIRENETRGFVDNVAGSKGQEVSKKGRQAEFRCEQYGVHRNELVYAATSGYTPDSEEGTPARRGTMADDNWSMAYNNNARVDDDWLRHRETGSRLNKERSRIYGSADLGNSGWMRNLSSGRNESGVHNVTERSGGQGERSGVQGSFEQSGVYGSLQRSRFYGSVEQTKVQRSGDQTGGYSSLERSRVHGSRDKCDTYGSLDRSQPQGTVDKSRNCGAVDRSKIQGSVEQSKVYGSMSKLYSSMEQSKLHGSLSKLHGSMEQSKLHGSMSKLHGSVEKLKPYGLIERAKLGGSREGRGLVGSREELRSTDQHRVHRADPPVNGRSSLAVPPSRARLVNPLSRHDDATFNPVDRRSVPCNVPRRVGDVRREDDLAAGPARSSDANHLTDESYGSLDRRLYGSAALPRILYSVEELPELLHPSKATPTGEVEPEWGAIYRTRSDETLCSSHHGRRHGNGRTSQSRQGYRARDGNKESREGGNREGYRGNEDRNQVGYNGNDSHDTEGYRENEVRNSHGNKIRNRGDYGENERNRERYYGNESRNRDGYGGYKDRNHAGHHENEIRNDASYHGNESRDREGYRRSGSRHGNGSGSRRRERSTPVMHDHARAGGTRSRREASTPLAGSHRERRSVTYQMDDWQDGNDYGEYSCRLLGGRQLSPRGLSPNELSPRGLSPRGLSPRGVLSPRERPDAGVRVSGRQTELRGCLVGADRTDTVRRSMSNVRFDAVEPSATFDWSRRQGSLRYYAGEERASERRSKQGGENRESGYRESGYREGGYRESGYRDGGAREGGVREGGARGDSRAESRVGAWQVSNVGARRARVRLASDELFSSSIDCSPIVIVDPLADSLLAAGGNSNLSADHSARPRRVPLSQSSPFEVGGGGGWSNDGVRSKGGAGVRSGKDTRDRNEVSWKNSDIRGDQRRDWNGMEQNERSRNGWMERDGMTPGLRSSARDGRDPGRSLLTSPSYPTAPVSSPMSGYFPPLPTTPEPPPAATKTSEGPMKLVVSPDLPVNSDAWGKLESGGDTVREGNPTECVSNPDSGYGSKSYLKGAGPTVVGGPGTSFTTAGGPSSPEDAPLPVAVGRRGVVSVAWDDSVQPDVVTNWHRTHGGLPVETLCPDNTPERCAPQAPPSSQTPLDDTSALLSRSMPRLDAMPANQKRDLLSLASQNELVIYRSTAPDRGARQGESRADYNQNRTGKGGRPQEGGVCVPTPRRDTRLDGGRDSVDTLVEQSRSEVGRSTTV